MLLSSGPRCESNLAETSATPLFIDTDSTDLTRDGAVHLPSSIWSASTGNCTHGNTDKPTGRGLIVPGATVYGKRRERGAMGQVEVLVNSSNKRPRGIG